MNDLEYLKRFRVPLPSSSARPIWVNTLAMDGFLGIGLKSLSVMLPSKKVLLAFSVHSPSRSIVSLAG